MLSFPCLASFKFKVCRKRASHKRRSFAWKRKEGGDGKDD
nr:MAG TPA: Synaptonemal complex 2 Spt16M-like domain [Caudoviricetes sp.]